ncbi:MAG TPA: class A beta-lactamase [Polyangiaceae bacterium]|nr:class A beta-lactamase [Polyangiaceae bacterium]
MGGVALAQACARARNSPRAPSANPFAELESRLGGRVGVAALDTRTGARLSHRADERFAMCSTFKWLLVAAVLSRVDHGELPLDRQVTYSSADLLEYSEITAAHVSDGHMRLADLCAAAIEQSDNTAANLLLDLIGGPAGVSSYLRAMGDSVTRLDRKEPSLNENLPGDERDTTTPAAMVSTMSGLLVGDALRSESRWRLLESMKRCRTGTKRLRAGLPAGWITGDKTGTGERGAANDVAIVWAPGERPPILIAAYLSDSTAKLETLSAAHASIGRIVVAAFT